MLVKRILGYALLIAGLGAGLYFILNQQQAEEESRRGRGTPRVVVALAERANFVDRIESLGTLRANESITVVSEQSGLVEEVLFSDGQEVEAGATLVTLESREQDAELAAANAKLEETRKQFERLEDLAARNVATVARLDEQRVALRRAEADVRVASAKLAERKILAPFTGQLGIRRVSPGALVNAGVEITTLDDVSVLKLDFSVPETFIPGLAVGQRILGETVAYPERVFEGEVIALGSRVDPVTRTVEVRAQLPNSERLLRPGMLMTVDLFSRERETIRIPESALYPIEDRQYVFVVKDGAAQQRQVLIGARVTGFMEITEGLSEGELVIVQGLQMVRDGSAVDVVNADGTPLGESGS